MNSLISNAVTTGLTCLLLLTANMTTAQAENEAQREVVFSCQLELSGELVEVSLTGDKVTYLSGVDLSNPDVSVTNTIVQTGYLLGAMSQLEVNSVTLSDGKSSYRVDQTIDWVRHVVAVYESVTVLAGDDQAKRYDCRSSRDRNPLPLRHLASQITLSPIEILERCLHLRGSPSNCFGVVSGVLMARGECGDVSGFQPSVRSICWEVERLVLDEKLQQIMSEIHEMVIQQADSTKFDALQASHEQWISERDVACAEGGAEWMSGFAYCYAKFANDRLEMMLTAAE